MKSERERQILYGIIYMWNLKYDTNKLIYKTETDSRRKQIYDYQGEREGWGELGVTHV